MDSNQETWQWEMHVTVFHGPAFGHRLSMLTRSKGRMEVLTGLGSWKGLGVPEPVLNQARALIDAKFTEHLVTRYGVQGELPYRWAGEAGSF